MSTKMLLLKMEQLWGTLLLKISSHNATKFGINRDCFTDIFRTACQNGNEKNVEFIIKNANKYGLELNLRDTYGATPFNDACFYGNLQNVKVMLRHSKEYNIDIDARNNSGRTGLEVAKVEGHNNIVKLIENWRLKESRNLTLRNRESLKKPLHPFNGCYKKSL